MRFRGTLAARVALLATIAVGLVVAMGAAGAYVTVRHQLTAALDDSLVDRAETLADRISIDTFLSPPGVPRWVLGAADVRLGAVDASGSFGFTHTTSANDATTRLLLGAAEPVREGTAPAVTETVRTPAGRFRVAAVPGNEPGSAVILAQSLQSTDEALSRLGFLLAVLGLLGVVGAAFAGWMVARNGLSPVRRLSGAVEEIARTGKLEPIPVEGNDEVATLAAAFNRLLAAVSASRDRQRQLVADAGHELRTPLTSLRTNLDLLTQADARGGLSPESRAELMDDVRFQIEELTTLIGDLTELAREEPILSQLEPVDLADIVGRSLERVRRRATALHFDADVEPWLVTGEAAALERAVTNLLDNAAKWSPPLGVVTVRLSEGWLYVADQGPGIAEKDLPHVFERFYRSTESRTMPGSGLGLSIVRAVAERHGGTVRAGAAPEGGAAFWMWLPPASPTAGGPASAAGTHGTEPARG